MNLFNLIEVIEIGPTELCNLKCSFCPRSQGYPNLNLHITEEVALEIRRQLDDSNYKKLVSIAGKGEPLLTKNFENILDILTSNNPKYKLRIVTNGKNLDKFEKYFNKIDTILYNVYTNDKNLFINEKNKYKKYKNIDLGQVFPENETNESLSYEKINLYNNKNAYDGFSNRGGYLKSEINNIDDFKNITCSLLFTKLYINWNGNFHLCCDDWTNKKISSIWEENILDYVENNKTILKYKLFHLDKKRDKLDICKNCTRYSDLKDRIGIEYFKKIRKHIVKKS